MTGHNSSSSLLLDPDIRNWVLLPIVLIMVLVGMCRTYITQLLASDAAGVKIKELKNRNDVGQAQRLQVAGGFVSPHAAEQRRQHLISNDTQQPGILNRKVGGANPMGAQASMFDAVKNNATFMVSNMVMIGWISTFFSGFVLVKIPFPLTMRFKTMLQRGIDLATLDVSYVSTLSWYFIVMFGLQKILGLVLGTNELANEARMIEMQMGMFGGGGGFDAASAFKTERDNLQVYTHRCMLTLSEQNLLQKHRSAK